MTNLPPTLQKYLGFDVVAVDELDRTRVAIVHGEDGAIVFDGVLRDIGRSGVEDVLSKSAEWTDEALPSISLVLSLVRAVFA